MSDRPIVTLGPGGEFDRLRAVFARLGPRVAGVGDDAALVTVDGAALALSCDLAIEGQHFQRDWLTAEEIGWRACAAALSDLAAMAAEPLGVLASVGISEGCESGFLEDLMGGVGAMAASCGADVWGGDLVRAAQVTVDVTVVGRADRPVRRSGARPGDGLWVTGNLGAPAAAVAAWKAGTMPPAGLRQRFARPIPRIAEAGWLRDRGATALIDVSDGIAGDAGHLAAASEVAVTIDAGTVPVHGAVRVVAKEEGEEGGVGEGVGLRYALEGGEEYELLVALPPEFGVAEARSFVWTFELPLTRIGDVHPGAGVTVRHEGRVLDLGGGFSHF